MTADKQVYYYSNHYVHCNNATIIQYCSDKGSNYKCCAGRNEPTTDNRHHAGHAIDCTLTAPCTVGKRRTHTHHKCHVRCRKRQFQRSTHCDEQTGKHKIHRCTHKVKGNILALLERSEALAYPLFYAIGRVLCYCIHKFCYRTYQVAGNR